MLFCCFWCTNNVETSCHKHFRRRLFFTINKFRRLLPASVTHNLPRSGGLAVAALTARDEARYWLRIAISAYPTCVGRACIASRGKTYTGTDRNVLAHIFNGDNLRGRISPVGVSWNIHLHYYYCRHSSRFSSNVSQKSTGQRL